MKTTVKPLTFIFSSAAVVSVFLSLAACSKSSVPDGKDPETSVSPESPESLESLIPIPTFSAGSETGTSAPPVSQKPQITWEYSLPEGVTLSETEEFYTRYVNEFVTAMLNNDTQKLCEIFSAPEGSYDFLKGLEFEEFVQVGTGEFIQEEEGMNNFGSFDFRIKVKNGADDVFTKSGEEWTFLYADDIGVCLFFPKGKVPPYYNRIDTTLPSTEEKPEIILLCNSYHIYGGFFESADDFNQLKEKNFREVLKIISDYVPQTDYAGNQEYLPTVDRSIIEFWFYSRLVTFIELFHNVERSEYESYEFTANQLAEEAEEHLGINNIDPEVIEKYGGTVSSVDQIYAAGRMSPYNINAFIFGSEWLNYYQVVSEDYTETEGTVVMNYYTDPTYLNLVKTMKYNFSFSADTIKLVSVEEMDIIDD